MKILALNAYHGGSHLAFLEGWDRSSRHSFTTLALPAYKWKWRMRHAAVTFADQLSEQPRQNGGWDLLFCTDMLNLAEFRGLAPRSIAELPAVVYFHENQLTYPNQETDPRDLHFAFTNLTSALAADQVWFNSEYHRSQFLQAAAAWMRQMPDHPPRDLCLKIESKSFIYPPGIEEPGLCRPRSPGPLRIAWVARWEHDKNPLAFFDAIDRFDQDGGDFRLSVLGQSFRNVPQCFEQAKLRFRGRIAHWGYQASRDGYLQALADADLVVSTAEHEFFGIAILEAVSAGCLPLVPRTLAYPEILGENPLYYHDGTPSGIANRLREFAELLDSASPLPSCPSVAHYYWPRIADAMDHAIDALCPSQ